MTEEQDSPLAIAAVVSPSTELAPVLQPESPDDFAIMADVLQKAAQTLMLQDVATARDCAYLAQGIFEDGRAKYSADDLAILRTLCLLVCLYEPFASALLMQTEGRYKDALARIDEAIHLSDQIQQSFNELGELPNYRSFVASFEPVMRPFPPLLRGSRISIEAELFGYQGNIEAYLELIRSAVTEYRTVKALRPSANPTFRQMVQLCSTLADRLETRGRNFEPMLHSVRYMSSSGNKILIIHGRNEGKWRELRELLEQRGYQPVVIEEMPDAGAVLIDKCIKYAADCAFAIALFTPDDMVKAGKTSIFQARPNVLFELGWFYGRFGPDRVLILKQEGTALPSDLGGVLTKNFHANVKEVIGDIELELPVLKV